MPFIAKRSRNAAFRARFWTDERKGWRVWIMRRWILDGFHWHRLRPR
jgi:hypothetical protein